MIIIILIIVIIKNTKHAFNYSVKDNSTNFTFKIFTHLF